MCLLPLEVRGNRTFDPLRISTVALGKVKFLMIDLMCHAHLGHKKEYGYWRDQNL